MENINQSAPSFTSLTDLAAERLGGKVCFSTDDFFAEKENLIKPGRGIFIPDKYTERGKWMDGWESRRKRTEGHDWCIIQLAVPGTISGVDIDTNHFLGNHPPFASIEAINLSNQPNQWEWQNDGFPWTEILGKSPLDPGSQNFYTIDSTKTWTHLKLHIYPDGGVARLKVYGEVKKDWSTHSDEQLVDLVAARNGGKAMACNDMFFSNMSNLIMPGRGKDMGDGWETKRNRTPNNRDWVMLQLAKVGRIKKVVVDTHHFKGNYPDQCSIEACRSDQAIPDDTVHWTPLLPRIKLSAHREHLFEKEILSNEPFSHVRLNIFPDGGISRLRLLGWIEK